MAMTVDEALSKLWVGHGAEKACLVLQAEVRRLRELGFDSVDREEKLSAEVERLQKVVAGLEGDKEAWRQVFDHVREQCDPVLLAECGGYVFRCVSRMREEAQTSRLALDVALKEVAELRAAIVDYFAMPSGEKKREIRLRFSLPVPCDHLGIGRPGCPTCDPRRPKPGAAT